MTIEEIKAKLKRYRFIAGEISDLLDERKRLRSLAEKITPSLSFAPVHGANTDKMAPVVANLIEVERYIEKRSKELLRARMEAEQIIDRLTDERHRAVLKCYYFSRRSWKDVAEHLHYSVKTATRLHGDALLALRKDVLECPCQPMIKYKM
jgi:DNA-directed RNA polymerase specialized sigma subunit